MRPRRRADEPVTDQQYPPDDRPVWIFGVCSVLHALVWYAVIRWWGR
ncbi:MAG: hypothetical protein HY323_14415 [Betaproteobacteria bacterium]|nr:hypothetical protein [Betaproteobacteria bacterium]